MKSLINSPIAVRASSKERESKLDPTMMNAGKVQNGRVAHKKLKSITCSNKQKKSSIPSLPEEIIFYILVWLPADILYNSVRYVCRKWYNIIQDPLFINEHLLRSTAGLFIQNNLRPYTAHFANLGKMNATVTEICFPFPEMVLATCNGLVLFRNERNSTIHVANPLTKQRVTVPKCSGGLYGSWMSLACARSTREYKVVCKYGSNGWKHFDCMIFTLGKDNAWKMINIKKLSDPGREIVRYDPLSKGGFLYWADCRYPNVVALDVESEMFYEFPSPEIPDEADKIYYVMVENSLSCMVQFFPGILWDVWVLSDPISGMWRKLCKIEWDIENRGLRHIFNGWFSQPPKFTYFRPVAWVNYEVVLFFFFGTPGPYVALNVKTGETFTFGRHKKNIIGYFWCDFAYSLVSLTPS